MNDLIKLAETTDDDSKARHLSGYCGLENRQKYLKAFKILHVKQSNLIMDLVNKYMEEEGLMVNGDWDDELLNNKYALTSYSLDLLLDELRYRELATSHKRLLNNLINK